MGSGASSAGGSSGGLEFYWDFRSPPSRCVHMTLKALGAKYDPKPVDIFKGEHKKPDYLKINPAGKVPAIKIGSFTMSESRAIATFLCNKYNTAAAKKLYPRGAQQRAEVDRLLLLSDEVDGAIQKQINLGAVMFAGGRPSPDQMPEAAKSLKLVSEYLGNNNWVAGNNMTIADFFLATPFWLYEICTSEDDQDEFFSYEGGSTVKAWLQRIRDLPYFDEVNAKGLATFKQIYASKV